MPDGTPAFENDMLNRCSICRSWYCGPECQDKDWPQHQQSCTPPPPLLGPGSEPEVSDDSLMSLKEETTDNLKESNVEIQNTSFSGRMMIQICQENRANADYLQEVEHKTEQLEVCLKKEDEKLELIHAEYAKIINDLKEVHKMQVVKIEKYEFEKDMLQKEAKVTNDIKRIKEVQLEWAQTEMLRLKTNNTMLKQRIKDQDSTVKNLRNTMSLAILINHDKVIPRISSESEAGMTRLKMNEQKTFVARISSQILKNHPQGILPLQSAVTKKRSKTKVALDEDEHLTPAKLVKLKPNQSNTEQIVGDRKMDVISQSESRSSQIQAKKFAKFLLRSPWEGSSEQS